ncbi:MAG TPA: signal peptidase I [Blastocatellia bacterium]|nr:signal peptidase I [Blastocatellia bacterium]
MADVAPAGRGERKGMAVASLVLGVISVLTLGGLNVLAVVGIILGLISLNKARHNPGIYGGRRLAIGGIVTNSCSILLGVIAAITFTMLVRPVKIEGRGMSPTLKDGDRALVWQQIEQVNRGDVVVFWYPDDPSKSFMKRVVGLPGEALRVDGSGVVYINNRALDESYLSPEYNHMPRPVPETLIKSHYYFVMGDNRDESNDSRSWGLVPEKYIYGKFIGKYWER